MTTTCKVNGSPYRGAMCGRVGVDINGGKSRCHAEPNSCEHQSDYVAPLSEIDQLKAQVEQLQIDYAESQQLRDAARRSGHPEPEPPYAPGTTEYRDYAQGFVDAEPLPMWKGEE
jgi:hypothetical protein